MTTCSRAYVLTCYVLTCYVLTCSAPLVAASIQAPADFSGRWTAEAPAAEPVGGRGRGAARGDMGSGWSSTIAITQDAKQLVVESMIYTRSDLQPQPRFVYALDGSETRNTVMLGRGAQVQSSRAVWEGASLRITTTHMLSDASAGKPLTMEVTQTLSLESPARLVVEVTRGGVLGGPSSTTRTIYIKSETARGATHAMAARTDRARSAARADSARRLP
jgi:hypothetical protein